MRYSKAVTECKRRRLNRSRWRGVLCRSAFQVTSNPPYLLAYVLACGRPPNAEPYTHSRARLTARSPVQVRSPGAHSGEHQVHSAASRCRHAHTIYTVRSMRVVRCPRTRAHRVTRRGRPHTQASLLAAEMSPISSTRVHVRGIDAEDLRLSAWREEHHRARMAARCRAAQGWPRRE